MKWSLKIGRILGIDVYIHLTFLLLLGLVGVTQWLNGGSPEAALSGVLFFSGLFLCVLLHEYGHALAARRYGIATRDITLLPIGGVARLERMPDKPSQELVVALVAFAFVVVAAALAAMVGYMLPSLVLGRQIARRTRQIENGLPDALDLLIVCIEAGSSVDQAVMKASDELGLTYPALAYEFQMINTEVRAGKRRLEAFKNFAARTQVPGNSSGAHP